MFNFFIEPVREGVAFNVSTSSNADVGVSPLNQLAKDRGSPYDVLMNSEPGFAVPAIDDWCPFSDANLRFILIEPRSPKCKGRIESLKASSANEFFIAQRAKGLFDGKALLDDGRHECRLEMTYSNLLRRTPPSLAEGLPLPRQPKLEKFGGVGNRIAPT